MTSSDSPLAVGKDIFVEPTTAEPAVEPEPRPKPHVPLKLILYLILIFGILAVAYIIFQTSLGW